MLPHGLLDNRWYLIEVFQLNSLLWKLKKQVKQIVAECLELIANSIDCDQKPFNMEGYTPVPVYTDENVSTKDVKIIQSYVCVVNKMVWRKEI